MSESTSVPEFNGECAFAVSLGKTDEPQSGKHSLEVDGKTYYFRNAVAKTLFRILPGRAEKAQQNWAGR